jgi:hypothetical protein
LRRFAPERLHCAIPHAQGYTFAAFKRDEPTKAFCLELREDVRGMRFLEEARREDLKQGYVNSRKNFGASRSGTKEADMVGSGAV